MMEVDNESRRKEIKQPTIVCGVRVNDAGAPCGRLIHPAPEYDSIPVCLMHSRDPIKNLHEFRAEFWQILSEADKTGTVADFALFVFPISDFRGNRFAPMCSFFQAECPQRMDFTGAVFEKGVEFYETQFARGAEFRHARFPRDAVFMRSKFGEDTSFELVSFDRDAVFMSAEFKGKADFSQASFNGDALFSGARFGRSAYFPNARFSKNATFAGARFSRLSRFAGSRYSGSVNFHETRFRHDFTDRPGLDFTYVKLECPEKVEFYRADLGQALFHHTDISKVDFVLVLWRDRDRIKRYRIRRLFLRLFLAINLQGKSSFSGLKDKLKRIRCLRPSARVCLFEEDVHPFGAYGLDLFPRGPDERNFGLIAELYQQLKRNYDDKGDYWTAGQWHYCEMEMKRLHSLWHKGWLRWMSRHISLVALYKYASAYGESYLKPLVWLLAVLIAFALAYPVAGLEVSSGKVLTFWNWTQFFMENRTEHPSGWWGMMLHSVMTTLSVAGFQRELRYVPSYPWGRLLALVEILLTTTLGALFALAIRRQFKRS